MRTIKRIATAALLLGFGLSCSPALSQGSDDEISSKVKIPVNAAQVKKIMVKDLLGGIVVKGVQGNEISIEVQGYSKPPKRADGLKPVYGTACVDNTGIGIAANESAGILTLCGASRGSRDAKYTMYIPRSIAVSIEYQSPFANDDIEISDMEGEIEVATLTANIKCHNVTGPLVLSSTSGDAEVTVSKLNQSSPTSIMLTSGDLDLTLPASTPANLYMNSISGEIYTDFELSMKSKKDKLQRIGGGDIVCTLNNWGVKVKLNCISGNIYLRKK
jgi:hypothetical protein